jgi:hypothetical protein
MELFDNFLKQIDSTVYHIGLYLTIAFTVLYILSIKYFWIILYSSLSIFFIWRIFTFEKVEGISSFWIIVGYILLIIYFSNLAYKKYKKKRIL